MHRINYFETIKTNVSPILSEIINPELEVWFENANLRKSSAEQQQQEQENVLRLLYSSDLGVCIRMRDLPRIDQLNSAYNVPLAPKSSLESAEEEKKASEMFE